jgi:Tol biopolymer transport system component
VSPNEWSRAVELFHAAREKTGGDRTAFLDSECSGDASLRLLIDQMLRDHEASGSFLNESPLQSPDTQVIPGLSFERYEIIGPLGRGGMGQVWKGHDPELNRLAALKFLRPEAAFGGTMDRLTREARAASALNHPNIVTVYEVIRHADTAIIAMELVDGSSTRCICGEPQPPERVVQIGIQIAKALSAAHAHGIVHCDIKPENILMRSDGLIKVLDFGLARWVETEAAGSGVAGTPRYMSPEQTRSEPLTPATDIYSLGLVLYELATGQHMSPGDVIFGDIRSAAASDLTAPSVLKHAVPKNLNSLILAMVARDRAERPSAEDVVRALSEIQRELESPIAGKGGHGKKVAAAVSLLTALCAVWLWIYYRGAGHEATFEQVTTLVPENRATAAAISPDGKLAAYANVDGTFVRTIETGETKTLSGPTNCILDRLAWFADAKRLVGSGFSTSSNVPSIWLLSTDGTAPRLLHESARGATPSPDGRRVAFISQDRSEIWVIGVNGESPRRILTGSPEDAFGFVLWFPDGRGLAFQRDRHSKRDVITYESVELATGRIIANAPAPEINSASELPDGRLMYLKWDNKDFTSSHQVWEVKTDPHTGAFRGDPHKIATLRDEGATLLGLTAARDGKRAMVVIRSAQTAVFVADFDLVPPRIHNIHRLTFDERANYPHAWTADNRAVIFESNRNGNFDLFKQYTDRRTPEPIVATPLTEILPQLSPDGRFVLYAARPLENQKPWFYNPNTYQLMRVPVDGGTPAEVPIGGVLDEFRCALGPGTRCVLRTSVQGEYRAYYDLDPLYGKGRELARTKWSFEVLGDWDVSPDGNFVAIPTHDSHSAHIRVIALQPGPHEPRERDLTLAGLTDLRGLVWATDGRAWFVSVDTAIGNRLLYVFLDGRVTSLGDIQGWAVPSRDGRRVAFLDRIIGTNAWMIDRR